MEIETKIFDVKKIRKVLKENNILPRRICDISDFIFDISHFSPAGWEYTFLTSGSGKIVFENISIEIPDHDVLSMIRDFFEKRFKKGSKIRIRVVDSVPYITIKGPKTTSKGIKAREEFETKIGSLSSMMLCILMSGGALRKSIFRVREIYHLADYGEAELVIDRFDSAHGVLEYAELECVSPEELKKILKKMFHLNPLNISDKGITRLHAKNMSQAVSSKLTKLEKLVEDFDE